MTVEACGVLRSLKHPVHGAVDETEVDRRAHQQHHHRDDPADSQHLHLHLQLQGWSRWLPSRLPIAHVQPQSAVRQAVRSARHLARLNCRLLGQSGRHCQRCQPSASASQLRWLQGPWFER